MNYPVTAAYLADRLYRAEEALPRGSTIQADIRQLALFYDTMNYYTQLTARDQEALAELAHSYVKRDEADRRRKARLPR